MLQSLTKLIILFFLAMGKSKSKQRPPLTEYQRKHVEKFRNSQTVQDRPSIPFPVDIISKYESLRTTCQYLNKLYAQFAELNNKAKKEKWLNDIVLLKKKQLRRRLAPQLMLALRHANHASRLLLSDEERERKDVKVWSTVIRKEYDKVYFLTLFQHEQELTWPVLQP